MITLYHGTNQEFDDIDLGHSRKGKDFGQGFYLSADKQQAEEMAKFKVKILGGEPLVQEYLFDESLLTGEVLRYREFDGYTQEWAEFILANRANRGEAPVHDYDIVYGPIANDNVGQQMRNLIEQNIDLATFLERLKYKKGITYQYFFGTERAIKHLKRV